MKQKYTLLIADMEINVITDEPQEFVENIVSILNRNMREILLKSKRCSKNEAALLCALDFCAEKIKIKEKADELENELESNLVSLKTLNEKIEMLQKNSERLEKENARLEVENDKLRAVLDDIRASNPEPAEQEKEEEKPTETVISQPVGDIFAAQSEQTNDKDIGEAKVIPNGPVEEEEDSEQKKKAKSRNRVGSMFDLLTFGDV